MLICCRTFFLRLAYTSEILDGFDRDQDWDLLLGMDLLLAGSDGRAPLRPKLFERLLRPVQ